MYTQKHNNFFFFWSKYMRMKKQIQRSIVLKHNMKKLMISLLPIVKKMVSKKINQIKKDTKYP